METLPLEILVQILKSCSLNDTVSFCLTCNKYFNLTKDWGLWSVKCYDQYNFPIKDFYDNRYQPIQKYIFIGNMLKNPYNSFIKCMKEGELSYVKYLIDYVDPSFNNQQSLYDACYYGNVDIAKVLLADKRVDKRVRFNKEINNIVFMMVSPIDIAISRQNLHVFDLLLEEKYDNPQYYESCFGFAVSINNKYIIDRLFELDIFDPYHWIYLSIACRYGNVELLDRLLKNPVCDITFNGNSELIVIVAIREGEYRKIDVIDRLLQDERIMITNRSLHIACIEGNIEIVNRLLLDPRVDPTTDRELIAATATHGYLHIVKRLLQDPRYNLDN